MTIKALPGHPARPDAAHVLHEVTKERGTRPHFQVVDVAVQGLVHSEDELRHAAESPPQGIQKSLRRHYAKVRVGTKTARRFVDVTNNQRSANHPPATFGISAPIPSVRFYPLGGRPSLYDPSFCDLVRRLARLGLPCTTKQLAAFFDVSELAQEVEFRLEQSFTLKAFTLEAFQNSVSQQLQEFKQAIYEDYQRERDIFTKQKVELEQELAEKIKSLGKPK